MSQSQALASPELQKLGNINTLPELLHGDWDALHHELTDKSWWGTFTPKTFDGIDVADYGKGRATYLGYKSERPVAGGPAIYVAETDCIDVVGRANIYFGAPAPGAADVPHVGFFKDYKYFGKETAERDMQRLLAMNAACLKFYGAVLYSEPHPSATTPLEAWHNLVDAGFAELEAVQEDPSEHFKFIGTPLVHAA